MVLGAEDTTVSESGREEPPTAISLCRKEYQRASVCTSDCPYLHSYIQYVSFIPKCVKSFDQCHSIISPCKTLEV